MKTSPANALSTPGPIVGSVPMNLLAQRRIEQDLEDLSKAEKKYSGAKAFAQGFAAGMTVPAILAGPAVVAEASSRQKASKELAHLRHWLESKGVQGDLRPKAAGLHKWLSSGGMTPDVEDVVRSEKYRPTNRGMHRALDAALQQVIERDPRLKDVPDLAEKVQKAVMGKELGRATARAGGKLPYYSDLTARHLHKENILAQAAEAFERSGKKLPKGMMARNISASAKKHLFPLGLLGLIGGMGGRALNKRRRAEAKELRELLRNR